MVEHLDAHQLEIGEVARSWPSRNVTAQLVAEPANPHDRHAVMVLLDGYKVGYLPQRRDPRYTAIVKHLAATQGPVRVRARIVGDADDTWSVVVDGHPECFDPGRHFCAGPRDVVVIATHEHQHLIDDLDESDSVPVRLGLLDTTAAATVTIAVEGIVVGQLPSGIGREYLHVLRSAIARRVEPTCPASVRRRADGHHELHLALTDDPASLADICD